MTKQPAKLPFNVKEVLDLLTILNECTSPGLRSIREVVWMRLAAIEKECEPYSYSHKWKSAQAR